MTPGSAAALRAHAHAAGNRRLAARDLTFTSFRGREGLRQIASEWAVVLDSITNPHFFQQYAWYEAIVESWPDASDDVVFVVAYSGRQPVAICPLALTISRRLGLTIRILAPPDPNAVAFSDFVYASTPANADVLPGLVDYLRRGSDLRWDLLELPRAFATSAVVTTGPPLSSDGWFRHARGVCYYYDCTQGMAAVSAKISGGLRKHMRRCRRQLSELGELEFVWSRDPSVLPELLTPFLALESSGWKGVAGEATAIALDSSLVQFYSRLLSRFAKSQDCEVNLLRLDGRNIAGQFCLISGGTWYHLKIAYDEEFDKYSPGFVLLEQVLDRLCRDQRIQAANFLTGAPWADRWHPDELEVLRLAVRSRTLTGRIALQEIVLRRFVRERAIPFLNRLRTSSAETDS